MKTNIDRAAEASAANMTNLNSLKIKYIRKNIHTTYDEHDGFEYLKKNEFENKLLQSNKDLHTHLLIFQIQNPLIADEKRKREEKRVKIFTTETVMYSIMRNQLDLGDVRYDMM